MNYMASVLDIDGYRIRAFDVILPFPSTPEERIKGGRILPTRNTLQHDHISVEIIALPGGNSQ
jgi:hypothetical protein